MAIKLKELETNFYTKAFERINAIIKNRDLSDEDKIRKIEELRGAFKLQEESLQEMVEMEKSKKRK